MANGGCCLQANDRSCIRMVRPAIFVMMYVTVKSSGE